MKDNVSIHKNVQDMCDCYATTDPLREMSVIEKDADTSAAAVKWLALTALHGVNNNAQSVRIKRNAEGKIKVTAEYRPSELPSPGAQVGKEVFEAVKAMTHIDGDKGKTALALGIRDSSLDLKVRLKKKGNEERVTIEFPD
jgi:hypothetical protein